MKKEILYDCEVEYQIVEFGGPRRREKKKIQTTVHPDNWDRKNYEQIQKYLTQISKTRCEVSIIKVTPLIDTWGKPAH